MIEALLTLNLLLLTFGFLHFRRRLKRMDESMQRRLKEISINCAGRAKTRREKVDAAASSPPVVFKVKDEADLLLDVPRSVPSLGGPFLALGPHKSGTVLLNALLKDLSAAVGMPFFDLPGAAFSKGVNAEQMTDSEGVLQQPGRLLGGFRTAWLGGEDLVLAGTAKAVVLVRDPRDILVSRYFSVARSHTIPGTGKARESMLSQRKQASDLTIDAWVIGSAASLAAVLDHWAAWVAKNAERVKVFRYEDVIFQKEQWLRDIDRWFGWNLPNELLGQIAAKHDIRPADEDASRHIRKVAPGDHKEKLKPETIAELNELLRGPAAKFGYQL